MRWLNVATILLYACCSHGKPMRRDDSSPFITFGRLGIDNQIVGGQDAAPGAWPWQLSQERLGATGWYHNCGASLLSATKALIAAHCVNGADPAHFRVIAGMHQRSDTNDTQASNCTSYTVHERYQLDSASFSNDIAIMNLDTEIITSDTVQFLTLPPDNSDNFAGDICTMTGWGVTTAEPGLPDALQQADIQVITTDECQTLMTTVEGTVIWDSHICLYDSAQLTGACSGDSGGPVNCPDGAGGYYVAGLTSFGVASREGICLQDYPSVYTRTSAYLDWIASN